MLRVALCAYDEEENIKIFLPDLIEELKNLKREFEIIFCLDGTSDNSFEVINNYKNLCQITILPVQNIKGLGNAYKKIFSFLLENSQQNDIVISFDSDNTHDIKLIPSMLAEFEKNQLDFIVASRFLRNSRIINFPFHRQIISKIISIYFQIIFPIKSVKNRNIQDYTSGFRIYSMKSLIKLNQQFKESFITEKDFTCLIEILIKLSLSTDENVRIRFDEYPLNYDYGKKIGRSKLDLKKNFFRLIVLTLILAKNSLKINFANLKSQKEK